MLYGGEVPFLLPGVEDEGKSAADLNETEVVPNDSRRGRSGGGPGTGRAHRHFCRERGDGRKRRDRRARQFGSDPVERGLRNARRPEPELFRDRRSAKRDAWAIGGSGGSGGRGTVTGAVFAHWNGGSWSPVTIKAAAGFIADNIYASSGDNIWIFGQTRAGDEETLVFNGKSWSLRKLAAAVYLDESQVAVLSATDVWAESGEQCPASAAQPCSEMLHWNGSTWASVPVSGLSEAVTSAGGHAWFLSLTGAKDDVPAIDETEGSKLVKVKAPAGTMGATAPGFAAAPNGRLWILGELASKGNGLRLWRWSGKAWTESVPPGNLCVPNGSGYCPSYLPFVLVYDGGNGVWSGLIHWTGTRWVNTQTLSTKLTDTSFEIPVQVAVTPVSGTVWGPSSFERNATGSSNGGLIIVYGRLP
jgi:hypothetical protein